ncbi:DUF4153 domain-containing protein [Nocardia wallacei]|uniref:DUF4153 domain-containing protein n=1 Tax=Nocardia wallacei TaxID=480035 RepID=UPI0024578C07|nr:DUF4173 domain-containing protein [Nocardia wallacei]
MPDHTTPPTPESPDGPTESTAAQTEQADAADTVPDQRWTRVAGVQAGLSAGIASGDSEPSPPEDSSADKDGEQRRGPLSGRDGLPGYPMRSPAPVAPPRWRRVTCPAGVSPAAGAAGVVAAVAIPVTRPGIGWLLAGFAAMVAVLAVDRRARREARAVPSACATGFSRNSSRSWERVWWTAATLALLAVGTFRAAGWLFALCVVAACVTASLAVVGRRSAHGVLYDVIAVPLSAFGALAWVYVGLGRFRDGAGVRRRRIGLSVAVTAGLLAVFVPLLGSADATFASLLDGLIPRMDADSVVRWIAVFALTAVGCLAAMYLLAGPPPPASAGRQQLPGRKLARLEWGLPVGALTVLFAVFIGAQLMALFGGDDYVQRTAGLTYAEYARSGFWQLSAVTVLTLVVILSVLRWAAQDSVPDRVWLRVLLCAIGALTLVIIASAFGRMWTYQQAYGFTVLRLLVGICELWLGVVYLLVLVAVFRPERQWLPRVTIGTAVATLLTLAALNPEGLIADRNIDRWQHGENLDTGYLATLSADIAPAVNRLPDELRDDLLSQRRHDLDPDTWNAWNLSRARFR